MESIHSSEAFSLSPLSFIIGVDEVGRGPLAGPVMACAAILPENYSHPYLQDSKKLTAKQRDIIAVELMSVCHFALGECSVAEIEDLNIYHASLLAMKRAVDSLLEVRREMLEVRKNEISPLTSHISILVDGKAAPKWRYPTQTIIKGDAIVPSISAASIIAKVTRDRLMQNLANDHPEYGWERNAGYATREHKEALRLHGITKHHRPSFLKKCFAENEDFDSQAA